MDVRFFLLVVATAGTIIGTIATRIGFLQKCWSIGLILGVVCLAVIFKFHKRVYVILRTLPRDVKFTYRFMNANRDLRRNCRQNMTVMKLFRERAKRYPHKPCFYFEDTVWTNADVNKYSNQIASAFQKAGYKKGDAVALMMPNRPEYVAIWLGLGKLGIVTALINTNLRLQSLAHCLTEAKVKAIIYSDEYSTALDDIADSIVGLARYKCTANQTCKDTEHDLNKLLSEASTEEPKVNEEPGYKDNLLYIYTSGTTGLPKVAVVPNSRYLLVTAATYYMIGLKPSDIVYNPIPLYHMSGGLVGTCCALIKGVPSALRTKFSVTAYWSDCIKYKCTIGQYIGEICRYLLSAPKRPEETEHSIRIMLGNGMKPQIWREFVERFKIDQVTEVYGSSEGNANIVNVDNKIGAVGCVPSFLPQSRHPVGIIRVAYDTLEPIRGPDGLCIRAEDNEPGMFVGIINRGDTAREFNGYLDKEASKRKIIENVFRKGDKAFLSGDILMRDELGYFYFKDRVGDTFRWKGENVATAEVESVISNLTGHKNSTVYGVEIPGLEGKAGMAAIADPNKTMDLKILAESFDRSLPNYARPIFLRIVDELETTGTFKVKKLTLQREGFNPDEIQDQLYFRASNKDYIQLTSELYREIVSGSRKL